MDREGADRELRWYFNACVLDETTLELRCAGSVVEVERKPLELLRCLLRHAGEVVTKDELFEAVWPGRIHSDNVLAKAVSRLREVLGPAAEAIRTVHGYGYRFVADVRVEAPATPAPPPQLGLQVGDAPPLRPEWRLVEHLDSGGRGEVWRIRSGEAPDQRVLKFALDADALVSLRREITLNRLLLGALGSDPPVVPLLDWNLQQPPFFIELPWLPLGSLADWAGARGGLHIQPLERRLDFAVQIAEALGAAHDVGVLHKDLKPGNVLLDGDAAAPRVRLADFGSGAMLAPERLDALGITRMGFTRAELANDSSSGTPLYVAPEVLAGQPPSARSDLYALGVLLYQLVVGDLRRPLSPGWERDVDDELLREDIAAAADGDPQYRLGDAKELARRLRGLAARRAAREEQQRQRLAEQRALDAAARLERDNERLRTRRTGLLAVLAVLVVGLVSSLTLYHRAQQATAAALESADIAETVTRYFTEDVVEIAAADDVDLKTFTAAQLFERLARGADGRFDGRPEVEARVRIALAAALESFAGAGPLSDAQVQAAFARIVEVGARDPVRVLDLARRLEAVNFMPVLTIEQNRQFDALLDTVAERVPTRDVERRGQIVNIRTEIARDLGLNRDRTEEALRRFDSLLAEETAHPSGIEPRLIWELRRGRAALLKNWGLPRLAEPAYREVIADPHLGEYLDREIFVLRIRSEYGALLSELGDTQQAEPLLQAFADLVRRNMRDDAGPALKIRQQLSVLRLAQGRYAEAAAVIAEAAAGYARRVREGGSAEVPPIAEAASTRVDALLLAGAPAAALAVSSAGLADLDAALQRLGIGADNRFTYAQHLRHVEALLANGRVDEARAQFDALPHEAVLERQPPECLLQAERLRLQALIAAARGQGETARAALERARAMLLDTYGERSWRLRRLEAVRIPG